MGPRFEQLRREVAACGDEERAGAHRDVGDLQFEQLAGRPELPLCGIALLSRSRVVRDWVERIMDDLLSQLAWRVVRPGCAAVERLRDEQRARHEYERVAAEVVAQERVVGRYPLE